MNTAKYFCVVLGSPELPTRNRVEDGIYAPATSLTASHPNTGDVLLFYCTGNYQGYEQQSPGIGITHYWDKEQQHMRYTYLPFKYPLSRQTMLTNMEEQDQHAFRYLGIKTHWLFELSRTSVMRILSKSEALLLIEDMPIIKPARPSLNFPVEHDFGAWPEHLSLKREDMYDDTGR